MVSKDDIVYVKPKNDSGILMNSNFDIIGTGFGSEKQIKKEVKEFNEQHPGEYEYGILKQLGSAIVEEPEDKVYSELEEKRFDTIFNRLDNDERIIDYYRIESTRTRLIGALHRQNIRYTEGEVDFVFNLDLSLFEEIPVSQFDEKSRNKIKNIFNDMVGDEGYYLGFHSSFASRGRRNPFVKVYGRIRRNTRRDEAIWNILKENEIKGSYWSTSNISPIPVYRTKNTDYDEGDEDIIFISGYASQNGSYEEIESKLHNNISHLIEDIESHNMEVIWVGKVFYNEENMQICFGARYISN